MSAARPASATSCGTLGPTGSGRAVAGSSRPMLERCVDARTRSERWRNRSVRRGGHRGDPGLQLEHRSRWGDGELPDQTVPLLGEGVDLLVERAHLGRVALARGVGVLQRLLHQGVRGDDRPVRVVRGDDHVVDRGDAHPGHVDRVGGEESRVARDPRGRHGLTDHVGGRDDALEPLRRRVRLDVGAGESAGHLDAGDGLVLRVADELRRHRPPPCGTMTSRPISHQYPPMTRRKASSMRM